MIKFKINPTQTIVISFLIAILLGTFLLTLPMCSKSGESTDFLTCLFTATSSMCVTGLVVVDTAMHWSIFGQIIILILIQCGGLGIIFVAAVIIVFLGRKVDFIQRTTLQEALSIQRVGGIIKLTKFILKWVIIIELIGAGLLFTNFIKEFDLITAIWYSVFHSISAFCNAGFDLMGFKQNFSSLTSYQSNILINITIMSLIIIGGLGFTVWDNIAKKKLNLKKYSLQSKIVIIVTFLLIIIPAIYFYIFEYNNLNEPTRILTSLFQSVTTRTAGYNTANYSDLSEVGQALSIILMMIGGSPGSTAGGVKTTTIAVIIISTIAVYKHKHEPHIFNRRIETNIVRNAIAIFTMYFTMFIVFGLIICILESCTLMEAFFEVASALGTVGLTLGITTKLTAISKILIIILMFLGRIGSLTFVYAIIPSLNKEIGYISENIVVG